MSMDELQKIITNPEYYRPIEIQIGNERVNYSIAQKDQVSTG